MSSYGGDNGTGTRGPTVHRLMLGSQLHQMRTQAGVTSDQAAHKIRASRSKISRMENGRVGFKERDVDDLLDLYTVTDTCLRAKVKALLRQANSPGWWTRYADVTADWFEEYLGLETAASMIRTFEMQFVHGLFQTPEYARAVTLLGHSAAQFSEIEQRVALRLSRQGLLTSANAPTVWSILDEGAIRRPVGGRAVMRKQLAHLAEVADLRNVTVQVVPFEAGGHAASGGSFTMLRFAGEEVPDIVYIEQLTSALYLDKREDVDHYLEVLDSLSAEALPPGQTLDFIARAVRELLFLYLLGDRHQSPRPPARAASRRIFKLRRAGPLTLRFRDPAGSLERSKLRSLTLARLAYSPPLPSGSRRKLAAQDPSRAAVCITGERWRGHGPAAARWRPPDGRSGPPPSGSTRGETGRPSGPPRRPRSP
jgi:transcriptional regulator with XRE-family HTH domain